ncbi:hypothetical protein E2320_013681 [Naja naja]|nr:hypothetical protein E2320_013681 [Naja naja]
MRTRHKRCFSFRITEEERQHQRREMMRNPSLRAKLISSPSNFNHLVHAQEGKKQEADVRMRCSSLSEMRRPSPEGHNGVTPLGSVSSCLGFESSVQPKEHQHHMTEEARADCPAEHVKQLRGASLQQSTQLVLTHLLVVHLGKGGEEEEGRSVAGLWVGCRKATPLCCT